MLEKKYVTLDDARRRLVGSYILVDKVPRLVTDVHPLDRMVRDRDGYHGIIMNGRMPRTTKGAIIQRDQQLAEWIEVGAKYILCFDTGPLPRVLDLDDERVDIKTFKVGMINTEDGNAYFMKRLPARGNYRQGLNARNIQVYNCTRSGKVTPQVLGGLLSSANLNQCVQDEYPTYEEALQRLEPRRSWAFNRDLALVRDELGLTFLHYKEFRIAWSDNKGKRFVVSNEYHFLTETLDKHGIPHQMAA